MPAPGLVGSKNFKYLLVYARRERKFFVLISMALLLTAFAFPYPHLAMWLGFMFAGYSAVANDSIQTIGTFIASNSNRKWYWLWLYIGLIFVAAILTSWFLYGGDVSFQRLQSKGLAESPSEFSYLQVAAPVILLILTRMRIPVSTTFMLLTSFSGSLGTITGMLQKSTSGYFIAFFVSISIWFLLSGPIKRLVRGKAHPAWVVFQWITSGTLWYLWIAQDAANVAVYLPRSLSALEVAFFCTYIFAGLGLLFYLKGDKIQGIVNEKSNVTDVRSATLIDLVYALILFWFQQINTIPMSTTWVFIGLLAGREIGMKVSGFRSGPVKLKKTMRLIGKDILYVSLGLLISMILAVSVNGTIRRELWAAVQAWFN
ncbi:MAG: hypothetical protein ACK417_01280 [Bacteroidia bacterium]